MAAVEELVHEAEARLRAGRFEEARAAVDEAHAANPGDARVQELVANVYLAHGIRLAGAARELRRKEIEARGVPGQPFEDSDNVKMMFRDVLAAFDRVLAVHPNHAKAWSLKAQALFRIDRANRTAALAAYGSAAKAIEASVPEGTARQAGLKNLLRDRRRIELPCGRCDDTGFCPECGGSGWRTILGFRRKCEACLGHGICKRCGVL